MHVKAFKALTYSLLLDQLPGRIAQDGLPWTATPTTPRIMLTLIQSLAHDCNTSQSTVQFEYVINYNLICINLS